MYHIFGLEQQLQPHTHAAHALSDRGGVRGITGWAQMEALETSEAGRVSPNNIASEASESSETLTLTALGLHVESLRQSMEAITGSVALLVAQVNAACAQLPSRGI